MSALTSTIRSIDGPSASRDTSRRVEDDDAPTRHDDLVVHVYRQMRTFAGPHRDLDDLVQTAIEQLLVARFEGRSKWSTFAHSVCYRVWLKHLRSAYRFRMRFFVGDSPVDQTPRVVLTAADAVQLRERYERLYSALEKVSPKRRAVVALHDIAEMSVEEIAVIVDAKPTTVRSRLRDGRATLTRLLLDDPYFGDDALMKGASCAY